MGTETKVTKKAKKLGQKVLDEKFEPATTVQQAGKWLRTADGAVRRAAAANNKATYDYSKKAQLWAAGELDKAGRRLAKSRKAYKSRGENQK